MPHNIDIIVTFTLCFGVALVFGFITQKLKLSPIVGYLVAGLVLGPYSPGLVADTHVAAQFAEIGVILLMFGVGLQSHFKDLMAVKHIAIPGALAQIAASALAGMFAMHFWGFSWVTGLVFGIAISVASTVVLVRVLSDNRVLHTPIGHVAVGWLVVEDLFTILAIVLLPVFFTNTAGTSLLTVFSVTVLKVILLVVFMLLVGKKLLPVLLGYVAKTGSRDLFTLSVLFLALGIAVGASEFFGASMALGAFLAGMVIGQSDFSARAASDALPMRDAFAVLFFVSVGMLFNPHTLISNWGLIFITLFIILVIKPLAAIVVVMAMKQPLRKAVSVGAALAQIGEFSFILIALGVSLGIIPSELSNAVIAAAIISIMLNSLAYKAINPTMKFLQKYGIGKNHNDDKLLITQDKNSNTVILVGYGPVGQEVAPLLYKNGTDVIVLEMNIETVKKIHSQKQNGLYAMYADATQQETLLRAGIEYANALVISAASAPAKEIIEIARALNPKIKILTHTTFGADVEKLKQQGADEVFSGEIEVAKSLSDFILKEYAL